MAVQRTVHDSHHISTPFSLIDERSSRFFSRSGLINTSLLTERNRYALLTALCHSAPSLTVGFLPSVSAFCFSRAALTVSVRHDRAEPQLIFARRQKSAHHPAIVSCFTSIQNIQI